MIFNVIASANASTVSKIESMGIRLWMSKISQCHLDMREAGELLNDIRQGILHVVCNALLLKAPEIIL